MAAAISKPLLVPLLAVLVVASLGTAEAEPLIRGKTIPANSEPHYVLNDERTEIVRRVFGLIYPFTLYELRTYMDFGSWSGIFVDSRDISLKWFLQVVPHRVPVDSPDSLSTLTGFYRLRVDAPIDSMGRRLEIGSSEETALVCMMKLYIDTYVPRAQQDSLVSTPDYYLYRLSDRQRESKILLKLAEDIQKRAPEPK